MKYHKSKFIEKYYDLEHNAVLVYEYRNHRYEVIDYGWKGGEPLMWQHNYERAHIDQLIENPPIRTTEDAQVGIDLFFSIYE